MKAKIKHIYEHHYKKLLFFPFLLIVLAFAQIIIQYSVTGDFVNKGVSLKGGSIITLDYNQAINVAELGAFLKEKFPLAAISVRTISSAGEITSIAIDSDAQESGEINSLLMAIKDKISADGAVYDEDKFSVETVGSSLGTSFFKQTALALLIAFILMGIVVMIYFRNLVPSLAVILAGFSDILVTLAIFNLTGMKLSTAGIAAFLMLIGYSVDTDILLTTRVLKRQGETMTKIYGAITTGLTMTLTTLAVVVVVLIFVQSEIIKQIMFILFIGLIVDMVMTWIQNVGILRIYLERKNKGKMTKMGLN